MVIPDIGFHRLKNNLLLIFLVLQYLLGNSHLGRGVFVEHESLDVNGVHAILHGVVDNDAKDESQSEADSKDYDGRHLARANCVELFAYVLVDQRDEQERERRRRGGHDHLRLDTREHLRAVHHAPGDDDLEHDWNEDGRRKEQELLDIRSKIA